MTDCSVLERRGVGLRFQWPQIAFIAEQLFVLAPIDNSLRVSNHIWERLAVYPLNHIAEADVALRYCARDQDDAHDEFVGQ